MAKISTRKSTTLIHVDRSGSIKPSSAPLAPPSAPPLAAKVEISTLPKAIPAAIIPPSAAPLKKDPPPRPAQYTERAPVVRTSLSDPPKKGGDLVKRLVLASAGAAMLLGLAYNRLNPGVLPHTSENGTVDMTAF